MSQYDELILVRLARIFFKINTSSPKLGIEIVFIQSCKKGILFSNEYS